MKIWISLISENSWDKSGLLKSKSLLYHWTSFKNIQTILIDNIIKASESHPEEGYLHYDIPAGTPVVCFTRSAFESTECCIIIDKSLLSEDLIKTFPYAYPDGNNEFEEFIPHDLINVRKYMIGVGLSKSLYLTYKDPINLYKLSKANINYKIYNYEKLYPLVKWLLKINIPVINFYNGERITLESFEELYNHSLNRLKQINNPANYENLD